MKVIKEGSKGPDVKKWQLFLCGAKLYVGEVDGKFGPQTKLATTAWQSANGLLADGVVGNKTWGAAMLAGLDVVEDKSEDKYGPNWPEAAIRPIGQASRERLFGKFSYKPNPTPGNPEGIKILGDWQKQNIVKVTIPQIKGIMGAPRNGQVFFHRIAAEQIKSLFQAWEDAGLIGLLKSWGGSWNPRFIRGSRSVLSNHAFASAFDINVPWNMLGRQPALVGQTGSVRELVPLANEYGLFWGGHFSGRQDGMHFEVAKLLQG